MKNTLQTLFAFIMMLVFAGAALAADFPQRPELSVTTGKLCDRPSAYRYAEKIPYCERDVTYETKEILMKEYDQKFNYRILNLPRADIKIDHLIPLCAGGSNDISNLWPQHKTVYAVTDPLEPIVCAKMAAGRLKQVEAVSLVIEAKTHLERTPKILQYINKL